VAESPTVASPPIIVGELSVYVGELSVYVGELSISVGELILDIDVLILSYKVVVVPRVVVAAGLNICCSLTGIPVAAATIIFRSIIKFVDFTVNVNVVPSLRITFTVNV